MVKVISVERWMEKHLAGIIRAYLNNESWVTERRLEAEVLKNHSIEELKQLLANSRYVNFHTLNPMRMAHLRAKFGISE